MNDGKEERVCKSFFKQVLLVSDGRITRLVKSKTISKSPPQDKKGKHTAYNKTEYLEVLEVKNFINSFPCYESHYSRMKNLERKYLSPALNIKIMYKKKKKNKISNPVSYYIFQEVLNKQFNLHFHAPMWPYLIVVKNVICLI